MRKQCTGSGAEVLYLNFETYIYCKIIKIKFCCYTGFLSNTNEKSTFQHFDSKSQFRMHLYIVQTRWKSKQDLTV